MGVKGLMRHLRAVLPMEPEAVPAGSVLVVDGVGWCFHVLRLLDAGHAEGLPLCSLLGGLYGALHARVASEAELLRGCGMELLVLVDGAHTRMKADARAQRRAARAEEASALLRVCLEQRYRGEALPLPRLCIDQFCASLRELGVSVQRCAEEADQAVALKVAELNAAGRRAYCLALDSDFVAFRACPYVELGGFEPDASGSGGRACVLRRERVAAALGLSEAQLVDLCVLAGNDYSAHLDARLLEAALGVRVGPGDRLRACVAALRTADPLPPPSEDPAVRRALLFSRDLYELRGLEDYPLDAEEEDEPGRLSAEQRLSVQRWSDGGTHASVGAAAIAYLSSSECSPAPSPEQLSALTRMLAALEGGSTPCFPHSWLQALQWTDLQAGARYQEVCAELCRDGRQWGDGPRQCFDGALFHSLLHEARPLPLSHDNPYRAAPLHVAPPPLVDRLPIDAYREDILARVQRDRVVIIHGETGCGKSSRLPVMLLEEAERVGAPFRLMASQPRRIAASSLMNRLRQSIGDKVGMRMGHGVRDEADDTCLLFVTTGYLVRLLAHRPSHFDRYTHIVVDEVHERSVDGDVLLYLCKRLLRTHPTIRLILMSATIHTELYRDYFGAAGAYGAMDCLSVGVRRFPLDVLFAEDLVLAAAGEYVPSADTAMNLRLPSAIGALANKLCTALCRCRGDAEETVPAMAKDQYALVVALVKAVAVNGTGVLVFVSGIADITELSERFEGMARFKVIAIHSDIPFEEQETAFLPCAPHEVKVVLATNAAESSITLPDVDLVICLGTHKALRYDSAAHRVQLVNTWVSKASATQRAGRTGRVRPGVVLRLYPRRLHAQFQEHEVSEVHRQPLQDVILKLKTMLETTDSARVVPVLMDLVEPPDMTNVEKSFAYLYSSAMISAPDDDGVLTSVGRMAGALPVDLQLSRLVAYAVALGVGAEACVVAAALSLPKTLFRIASPFVHTDPDEYNEIVRKSFLAACAFDGGQLSEPLMMVSVYAACRAVPEDQRFQWALRQGMAHVRLKLFLASAAHLVQRVNLCLAPDQQLDAAKVAPCSRSVANRLRLALLWTSEGNIIRMRELKAGALPEVTLSVAGGAVVPEAAVHRLLGDAQHTVATRCRRQYEGEFNEERLASSVAEILGAVASIGLASGAPMVWVGQELQRGGENDALVFVFYVLEPNSARCLRLLHGVFGATQLNTTNAYLGDGRPYLVVFARQPTAKQRKAVRELHNTLERALSIDLPCQGAPRLVASNCALSQREVDLVFFGQGASRVRSHVAMTVLESRQSVLFEEEPAPAATRALAARDFPVGYRLLNALRMGYKDRQLRLPLLETAVSAAVVGSAAWTKQKSLEQAGLAAAPDRSTAVASSGLVGSWGNVVGDGEPLRAVISSQSHLAASVHRGAEPLFGVAHDTLLAGEPDRLMVFCRGVTLLPPGPAWISLALACAGRGCSEAGLHEGKRGDSAEACLSLCAEVRAMLEELKGADIQADPDMALLVDHIFADWVEDGERTAEPPVRKSRGGEVRARRQEERRTAPKNPAPKSAAPKSAAPKSAAPKSAAPAVVVAKKAKGREARAGDKPPSKGGGRGRGGGGGKGGAKLISAEDYDVSDDGESGFGMVELADLELFLESAEETVLGGAPAKKRRGRKKQAAEAATSSAQQPSGAPPSASRTAYACSDCGEVFGKWGRCRTHISDAHSKGAGDPRKYRVDVPKGSALS